MRLALVICLFFSCTLGVSAQGQSSVMKVAAPGYAAIPGEMVRVTFLHGTDLKIKAVQPVFLPGGVWLFKPNALTVGDQILIEGTFFVSADIAPGSYALNFQAIDVYENVFLLTVNLEVLPGFPQKFLQLASKFTSEVAFSHARLGDGRTQALMHFSTRRTPEKVITEYGVYFAEHNWHERLSEHFDGHGYYIAKKRGRDIAIRYQRDYITGVSAVTVALDQ